MQINVTKELTTFGTKLTLIVSTRSEHGVRLYPFLSLLEIQSNCIRNQNNHNPYPIRFHLSISYIDPWIRKQWFVGTRRIRSNI